MKKIIFFVCVALLLFANSVFAEKMDQSQIKYEQQIGNLNEIGEITEKPLDQVCYFHEVLGETDKEDIAFGTIVSNGKAADIRYEDLQKFLDTYWNFTYEREIAPLQAYINIDDTYIKLWNKDKSKSYIIYDNSNVALGTFGEPTQSHGETKTNYLWYSPVIGNGRTALYSAFETVRHTYFDKNHDGYFEAQRDITEADKIELPTTNLLPISGASEWAKPEIQKAAACNLLIYEITDKYQENITRLDFCKLAQKLIATEFCPYTDTRIGFANAINKIIDEKGLRENNIVFSDCADSAVDFMARAGIVNGMGDGTFAPDDYITREQAATVLYNIAKFLGIKTIPDISYEQYYYDLDKISDWAVDCVIYMNLMNIMNGESDGYFYPQNYYTAEQAVATMVRLYECY